MPVIAGIVLAAGSSSRMGPQTNKLTQEIGGKPLLAWPVDALLEAGVEPLVVVTGCDAEVVEACLADRGCTLARHADWEDGMGSSIAFGLSALASPPARGLLVCVGDLPGLSAAVVTALLDSFERDPSPAAIHLPVCDGRRGHPVLFGVDHLASLAALRGDRGARDVIAAHAGSVVEVAVDNQAIFLDVDTAEELRQRRASIEAAR